MWISQKSTLYTLDSESSISQKLGLIGCLRDKVGGSETLLFFVPLHSLVPVTWTGPSHPPRWGRNHIHPECKSIYKFYSWFIGLAKITLNSWSSILPWTMLSILRKKKIDIINQHFVGRELPCGVGVWTYERVDAAYCQTSKWESRYHWTWLGLCKSFFFVDIGSKSR